jgi:hypothetical protein
MEYCLLQEDQKLAVLPPSARDYGRLKKAKQPLKFNERNKIQSIPLPVA